MGYYEHYEVTMLLEFIDEVTVTVCNLETFRQLDCVVKIICFFSFSINF